MSTPLERAREALAKAVAYRSETVTVRRADLAALVEAADALTEAEKALEFWAGVEERGERDYKGVLHLPPLAHSIGEGAAASALAAIRAALEVAR